MTRGIHLKQLTSADLELLGLAEVAEAPVLGPTAAYGGATQATQKSTQACHAPVPPTPPEASPPRVGPPANPASGLGQAPETEPDLDWGPIDLAALAREMRLELEATLRLLDGTADQAALPE